jgi:hypothetical protein
MDKDKVLLRKLHSAVIKNFNLENKWRRERTGASWKAWQEADRVLTVTVAEVTEYLKQK